MRCVVFLSIAIAFATCALAQLPATQPAFGKIYRSSVSGIEFIPPAGGVASGDISNGEIARFTNSQASWDLRVKPVPLHLGQPLTAPEGGGVLELIRSQLTESNPAVEVLVSEVRNRPDVCNGAPFGLIEARFDSATDRIFSQQAIFRQSDNYYLTLQMNSHGKPKTDTSNTPDPAESEAKSIFAQMLPTVHLLDRSLLRKEQDLGILNTQMFWFGLDEKKIVDVLQPLHFIRLIRDGKDVGFIQMNERQAIHTGNAGVEVIVRSTVLSDLVQPADAAATVAPTPVATVTPKSDKPSYFYTSASYFVTFDRKHEGWTAITQLDDQVLNQITESANSDVTIRRRLDARKAADNARNPTTKGSEPPVVEIPSYTLDIAYAKGPHQDKPTDIRLPTDNKHATDDTRLRSYYLPQAIGQLLPRLLPLDPTQYLFAFYVSAQRNVMSRYIDVGQPRDVELGGETVRAIPISDRIGVDGSPTVHYVTRNSEWLGSVNDDLKLQMLPTNESALKDLWPGFAVSPEPPLETDATTTHKKQLPDDSFDLQNSHQPGR